MINLAFFKTLIIWLPMSDKMIFIFIASNTFLRWLLIGFDKHKTREKKNVQRMQNTVWSGLTWLQLCVTFDIVRIMKWD